MVFNKIDLLEDVSPRIDRDDAGVPIRVWVSALKSEGLDLVNEAIAELKASNKTLKRDNSGLEKRIRALRADGDKLREDLAESRAVNKELAGFVRAYAKDLDSLLAQSPQSALAPDRGKFLGPVIEQERFWSMDDLYRMADVAFDEILASGRVDIRQGPVIDRQGRDRTAQILTLGNFTSIYVLEEGDGDALETGFLIYSDQSRRFFALSKLPSVQLRDQLEAYLAGASDAVPMDMSRGGALRRFTHELNLAEQVPKGGPIVWPILVILGLAVLILLERAVFFLRRRVAVLDVAPVHGLPGLDAAILLSSEPGVDRGHFVVRKDLDVGGLDDADRFVQNGSLKRRALT